MGNLWRHRRVQPTVLELPSMFLGLNMGCQASLLGGEFLVFGARLSDDMLVVASTDPTVLGSTLETVC